MYGILEMFLLRVAWFLMYLMLFGWFESRELKFSIYFLKALLGFVWSSVFHLKWHAMLVFGERLFSWFLIHPQNSWCEWALIFIELNIMSILWVLVEVIFELEKQRCWAHRFGREAKLTSHLISSCFVLLFIWLWICDAKFSLIPAAEYIIITFAKTIRFTTLTFFSICFYLEKQILNLISAITNAVLEVSVV